MIDETMEFLRKYLATRGAGHEIDLAATAVEPSTAESPNFYAAQVID